MLNQHADFLTKALTVESIEFHRDFAINLWLLFI